LLLQSSEDNDLIHTIFTTYLKTWLKTKVET